MGYVNNEQFHKEFIDSDKRHILMITNHGYHSWEVIPGLPDTGGQNVYVNQFTDVLANFGFRITIVNRGGYKHPVTGDMRKGLWYKSGQERILYIEDDVDDFIRKEDMDEKTPQLTDFLYNFLTEEGTPYELIMSHYWDAAKIGVLLNRKLKSKLKHIWIPHSLGAVKKRNMPKDTWDKLRVDERIEVEQGLMPELNYIAATSSLIRSSLQNDYNYAKDKLLFLPPCVKTEKFRPMDISGNHEIWNFLKGISNGLSVEELQNGKIITEISRTDQTKRKDVLIKAFAELNKKHPDTILVAAIDKSAPDLYKELTGLAKKLGVEKQVIALGHEPKQVPYLYNITEAYCSPSIMEGFGMSVQEAAASRVPVIGSTRIPFVKEYLIGDNPEKISYEGMTGQPLLKGKGGFLVEADDVAGFTKAMEMLIGDDKLRKAMGDRAYDITIPYFTWEEMTKRLFATVGISLPH